MDWCFGSERLPEHLHFLRELLHENYLLQFLCFFTHTFVAYGCITFPCGKILDGRKMIHIHTNSAMSVAAVIGFILGNICGNSYTCR